MKKVTSILTSMLLLCSTAYSQDESLTDSGAEQQSKEIEIYFDLDSYASPDGGKQYNETITEQRTNAITDYLREETSVTDSIVAAALLLSTSCTKVDEL